MPFEHKFQQRRSVGLVAQVSNLFFIKETIQGIYAHVKTKWHQKYRQELIWYDITELKIILIIRIV